MGMSWFTHRTPTEVVKRCSIQYWDAYLKDSDAAKKYLQSDRLVKDSDGKCAFEWKSAAEERGVSQAKEYAW